MRKIYELLYDRQDIYVELGHLRHDVTYKVDLQGWGGHREYFAKRVEETEPKLIIEVGTWKGRSAVTMADICKERDLDVELVCVDTWLGATEFWTNHDDPKRYKSLDLHAGYPQVYYQFLTNVHVSGHDDVVTPFPQTSTNAARLLRKNGVKADLVYIDASHEYEDVRSDLENYYDCLRSGGVMFGDDYCDYWKGVVQAVDEFAGGRGLRVTTERYQNPDGQAPSDYWRLRKP